MAFFGLAQPQERDRAGASRGIFEQHDPFAGLSGAGEDDEALNFEDTYDGLGQQLDESGDAFNEDTFGLGEPVTRESVGKDFDFAGQTAKVRSTLLEEQARHQSSLPTHHTQSQKQTMTGYEAYRQPEYIPKLEADASIWGKPAAKKPTEKSVGRESTAASKKMMSLEEVEAMMRAQAQAMPPPAAQHEADRERQSQGLRNMLGLGGPATLPPVHQEPHKQSVQILQRPPQQEVTLQQPMPEHNLRAPQVLLRQHSPMSARPQSQDFQGHPPQPSIAHQQHQMQANAPPVLPPQARYAMGHNRGPSYAGPPITQAQQMMSMTPEEREAYLAEEAKRAKRNHKIFLLSKNNGLMTPQDKNFITRIQLQQLLTATGGVDHEPGSEEQLTEDFYYTVFSQIRGGPPRSGPGQPLNHFAQTYLFQTGSRYGFGRARHHPRGGDNHVQRMEQQVARAVEAAKARPKNKQLVVEGSLGKIAFSNSKTPRPLLNLKRPDSEHKRSLTRETKSDRKATLRDIEQLYTTLMKLEETTRKQPPSPTEESPAEVIERHMQWRSQMQQLHRQLWEDLKVMAPVELSPASPHPFIQILSHSKGKRAIPRVFRYLDDQQRLTMLTLIVIHLDVLDVVRDAYPAVDNTPLPVHVKEEIELFLKAVIIPLFTYINEAPLSTIIGLMGLILERTHVPSVVRTKVGVTFLSTLISRAEIVKQTAPADNPSAQVEIHEWSELYDRLFVAVEPMLPYIFPTDTNVSAADDVEVWKFLAAMGVGASPDQQQRLVLGVKDRVMETVAVSKGLPKEMRERRLGHVNLFMVAIGLDVALLG